MAILKASEAQAQPAQLVPVADIQTIGRTIFQSRLFGIQTVEQAVALCLIAQAEGRHPASAAMDYHIIQNRPALKADAMLARFFAAGGQVEWLEMSDTKVSGRFSHPQACPKGVVIDWDDDRVKLAQLKKDNHIKYPRAMKRARVISEGIRSVYPGVLGGMYTPEEVIDFEPEPQPEPANEVRVYPEPHVTRQPHESQTQALILGGEIRMTRTTPPRPFIRYTAEVAGEKNYIAYMSPDKAQLQLGYAPETYRGAIMAKLVPLDKGGFRAEELTFLDKTELEGYDAESAYCEKEQGEGGGGEAGG